MRILVVDDDDAVRLSLAWSIEALGFEADGVTGRSEAVRLASKERYRAFVVDRNLRGEDGWELLGDLLLAQPRAAAILVSGDGGALADGPSWGREREVHFLEKPCLPERLEETLRAILLGSGGGEI